MCFFFTIVHDNFTDAQIIAVLGKARVAVKKFLRYRKMYKSDGKKKLKK